MASAASTRARLEFAALALALLIALGAFAPAAVASEYVALGDSYTSGPFIPQAIPPWGCLKSDHNYAHLAAPRLGLTLEDRSCNGAHTDNMTRSQAVWPEPNPAQFDALDSGTRLVTLGIGGNDIDFAGIALSCVSLTRSDASPCMDRYTAGGIDQISRRIADTGPKVAGVLQAIHARAPSARVLVVNYPAIFPGRGPGCFPQLPVADGDVPWLRNKEKELNRMLAVEAAANGASLVNRYRASLRHDACELPGVRWLEPVLPASPALPIHPNLAGMTAAADLVVAAAD
ncbi:MAG TPA: SGNH/GDSL hydrolase family protein [Thermoleophilaceae bacterium]